MGSRPWKAALFERLSPDMEDEWLVCTKPNGTVIEGRYLGWSSQGRRQFLEINNAPESHPVDDAFFSFSRDVTVERGLKINGQPAERYDPSVPVQEERTVNPDE
jgi:hypothetical protein